MKLLILSDANSVHTYKWVFSLKNSGLNIKLFSLFKPNHEIKKKYTRIGVSVISPEINSKLKNLRYPAFKKISYLKSYILLMKTIKTFSPKILHAHYASSYGILGLLSRFRPFILSTWGSDVYHFPQISILNKLLLKYVIRKSDVVCSTSNAMKNLIQKNFHRFDVYVVPFGVDVNFFKPRKNYSKALTVGTIKSIEDHNGIDCLIDAAKIIVKDYNRDINFNIVGEGTLMKKMQKKVEKYNLQNKIKFFGFIKHEDVVEHYNNLSIFIAVSLRESFGVSILEAAACGVPSITSNVGGLMEVNLNNKTGMVIEPNNPNMLANSIVDLCDNEEIRRNMGNFARKRVERDFNWNNNVNQMLSIYEKFKND